MKGFSPSGVIGATLGGTLGALGAVCIIWAFRSGGSPLYVMPLVFAGAPVVNVLYTMIQHPPRTAPSPMLYVGFVMAALFVLVGAKMAPRWRTFVAVVLALLWTLYAFLIHVWPTWAMTHGTTATSM